MRVARADGLAALIGRLDQIDGTRAPLHPLVLTPGSASSVRPTSPAGPSALSAVWSPSLSSTRIGRQAFDRSQPASGPPG